MDEEDTILVLDMGGGTYDISIVESFDGIFEVCSCHKNVPDTEEAC